MILFSNFEDKTYNKADKNKICTCIWLEGLCEYNKGLTINEDHPKLKINLSK